MLTTIITAIICSSISSFLIGRIYLNRLYASSNAGHRQAGVILATKELFTAAQQGDDTLLAAMPHRHRHSLGALLLRMFNAYQGEALNGRDGVPLLTSPDHIDIWFFYEQHIRPVKVDMNNNSFIGWLSFVHNVKLMTTIWDICHIAEDIITNLAAMDAIAVAQNSRLPYERQGVLLVFTAVDEKYEPYLTTLRQQYAQLAQRWNRWLQLNKLDVPRVAAASFAI
ncbi:hypothetical protein [Chitinophaga sp.]|uniref:hypothetical protein n=1 Tax=Chitinophaga sp. TaxID=1869181 RepID=UPI0031E0B667